MNLESALSSVGLSMDREGGTVKAEAREVWQERGLERLCKLN